MKILHVSDVKDIKNNGVAKVVPYYVGGQLKYADTALLDIRNTYSENKKIRVFNGKQYKHISELPNGFDKPDIVIFHEVYKPRYLKLYKECLKNNIAYIVMPHGCMTRQAQNKKKIKKTVFNFISFFRFLKRAKAIHYLSDLERVSSKVDHNSFIVCNGYDKQYHQSYAYNKESNYFIYVGRYDIYHKGLDRIVETCKKHEEWFRGNGVSFKMFGSSKGQQRKLMTIVKNHGISDIILVNKAIYGKKKIDTICNAIAFVQASRFEGLPQGVSEALSYGVPCIATKGSAFYNYVNDKKCGIGVDDDAESIFKAMNLLFEKTDLRKKYSQNAIACSKKDFGWDGICKKCITMYCDLSMGVQK